MATSREVISVPIRGLFNLTVVLAMVILRPPKHGISVPIRGLFNLTLYLKQQMLYSLKMPLTAEIVNRPQIAL